MPIPDTSGIPPFADFDMLKSKINEIVQKYNNLLVNLDTLNVVSLNAKVIEAGTITGEQISADAITADKIDVNQLSAISADLGTITAGLMQAVTMIASSIYGSYIATANGTYPRCEMNSSSNQFGAFFDANNWIEMLANASGTPLVQMSASSGSLTGAFGLDAPNNQFKIVSNKSINLVSGSGSVIVPSWSVLFNNSSGQNLQTVLNGKANTFTGFTGTRYAASTSGGTTTTAMNFVNGILTS